jgi:hypothetical protein
MREGERVRGVAGSHGGGRAGFQGNPGPKKTQLQTMPGSLVLEFLLRL